MPDALAGRLRGNGRIHLVPYLMAGFPDRQGSVALGRAYAAAGAGAIEVGVPFSDPLADGPVIQQAGQVALEGGMTMAGALSVAGEVAEAGPPVVLMTYVNPVLRYGAARLAREAAAAGVAGVIVPDLPVEEAEPVVEPLREAGVDPIFLVAPTTPEERIAAIGEASRGFVYCVSLTGVTGARDELDPGVAGLLAGVRRHTTVPVAVGFGISRPEHVVALRGLADAAVVASALLARIQAGCAVQPLLEDLVSACQ
jgi:tryptophan synthase alpha chain